MTSDLNTDPGTEQTTPSRTDAVHGFLRDRRADAARIAAGLRDRWRTINWAEVRYIASGAAQIAAALGGLALIAVLANSLINTAQQSDVARLVQRILDSQMARLVHEPITAYLTEHSLGLPLAPHGLALVWAIACAVLLVFAWAGSHGARIGWVLVGAASAAMAYDGAQTVHAPLAAGVTALVWIAGSVPAFVHYQRHRAQHTVVLTTPEPRPAPVRLTASQQALISLCRARAEELLHHANVSLIEDDCERWTRASGIATDLIRIVESDQYVREYAHKLLDRIDPQHYLTAPKHTDLMAARVYLSLAAIGH
ncbi:hypothetical protein [Lentzea sp. CA-135723]|uniref:hypothetical protein n=1 Tax=Lentzea sp. CA-135723 TaxID=3239950 RepID=UPI003D8A19A0